MSPPQQSKKYHAIQVISLYNFENTKLTPSLSSVDVSGPYDQIERTIVQAEEELGPIFLLANCAGYAKAARFEDTSIDEVKVPRRWGNLIMYMPYRIILLNL